MSPDNIMRSDVLDIIFENKNKAYGAYDLRRNYHKRLRAALIAVSVLVISAVFINQLKPDPIVTITMNVPDDDTLKALDPVKPEEPEQLKPKQPEKVATIQYTIPKIVEDPPAEDSMPPMDIVENAVVSDHTTPGEETGDRVIAPQQVKEVVDKVTETNQITVPEVLEFAEKMPSFPGGINGLKKYMQRNLMQVDDLEEGQKIVIVAKFIVKEDGTIDETSIVRTGRPDLDKEVLRVIRKMPQWEPGKQNGRLVSVWFQLPVTFVSEN